MTLTLILEGSAAGATNQPVYRLERGRVTIGRSQECDWQLPDPERTLSRKHCFVEERSGRFFVTDTSKNGLFVDGASTPLGQHSVCEIFDGSVLALGDFVVRVAVAQSATSRDSPFDIKPVQSPSPQTPDFDSLFGDLDVEPEASPPPSPASNLLDESFLIKKPMRSPEHPAKPAPKERGTPHDHTPFEFGALDLPKRKTVRDEGQRRQGIRDTDDDLFGDTFKNAPPPPAMPQPSSENFAQQEEVAGDFVRVFLEAAGVDPRSLHGQSEVETAKQAGKAFAAMAQGMTTLLQARASVKREAGLEQTMIGSASNNALKYSVTPEEAVLSLIQRRGQGYMQPLEAIEEAISDLKHHELAVLDGMQAALYSLLRRFDPERLERELAEKSRLSAIIAGGRKAQTWEVFKERYQEIAESARKNFMGELGPEFSSGYRRRVGRRS